MTYRIKYGCTCPGDCSGAHLAAKDRARADRAEAELRRVYLAVRNQDVARWKAEAALATARSERDEARADAERAIRSRDHEIERANQWSADFRVIAEAVGAVHDQSMGPSHPGTVNEVLARILTMNDNARAEALREAAGVPSRVIAELRRRGLLTAGDESVARSIESGILALIGASESGGDTLGSLPCATCGGDHYTKRHDDVVGGGLASAGLSESGGGSDGQP